MSRLGVDYETVKQTAVKLLSQGTTPSVQKIREVLGTGSNTTIAEHLKVWREDYAKKTIHHLPTNMPKELISAFEVLWQTAVEQAQSQLAAYKLTLEGEREASLQIQRDAEKTLVDIQQKLTSVSSQLEQALAEKQKLNLEIAITQDRLAKHEEAFALQKTQYEDRLQRVYAEKDQVLIQHRQLQSEIKLLQEKLSSQAQQHQHLLAQQHTLHEQSENRWLRLVDQAKQETKEAHKKLEHLREQSEEQIEKLKQVSFGFQKDLLEKNTQLQVAVQQLEQLKQAMKALESENIQAKYVLLKRKEEKKLKGHRITLSRKTKRGDT